MEGRSRSPWKRSYIRIKFYEQGIQDIVDHNRAIFEPDSEAVTEALEWLRNNHNAIIHSYDPINHQENVEIQLEIQDHHQMRYSMNKFRHTLLQIYNLFKMLIKQELQHVISQQKYLMTNYVNQLDL